VSATALAGEEVHVERYRRAGADDRTRNVHGIRAIRGEPGRRHDFGGRLGGKPVA
jgi:hypothetical protein